MTVESTVDLSFRVAGKSIPADHGYALYAAVSQIVPAVHAAGNASLNSSWKSFGIHPINGRPIGGRKLALLSSSRLTFRLHSGIIKELLPIAGKELDLDGSRLRVGVPMTRALKPSATLWSRLVTIKHRMEPESFLLAVQAELAKLNIRAPAGLLKRRGPKALEGKSGAEPGRCPYVRRTINIHGREVVGYAVVVQGLTAEESLRLQETGIGGRRRFGCGIFVPVGK